jgi:feruloyl esterase
LLQAWPSQERLFIVCFSNLIGWFMSKANLRMVLALVLLIAGCPAGRAAATSCEKLAKLVLPKTTVSMAQLVAAGAFLPPMAPGATKAPNTEPFRSLPAFCRVAAIMAPSRDSEIKMEAWLPLSGWNGKFQGVGNGGWAGSISYGALAGALARGYAAASTDTGHTGGSGSFALGHPEKLIDFAYRAVHEMTVKSKVILKAFYGSGPKLSYWVGCSNGGRQALQEAQRFPSDYDGIVAGAPANDWTHLMTGHLWIAKAVHTDDASYIPPEKYALIHKAVLDACDALDGLADGVLDDPTRCRFDPKVLECKSGDPGACLTPSQVEAARKIYAPAKSPHTGQEIFPGLEPGSELGWAGLAGPTPFSVALDYFKYVVAGNAGWDWQTIDFERELALADRLDSKRLNAMDPNLKPFTRRGGKLLIFMGWNDQLIAPRSSIDYYQKVTAALGGPARTAASVRLFMVPGMNHCGGGEGPCFFDILSVLEQWVEQKKAPEQMIASHKTNGTTDRTRPLCPFPQVARYKGSGSTDEAASFGCQVP